MFLPAFLGLFALFAQTSAYRFVCYYGSWSIYRQGQGKFRVEDIDPNLCTHIVYTFGGIDYDGKVKALDAWNDIGDEWHEGEFDVFSLTTKETPKSDLETVIHVSETSENKSAFTKLQKLRSVNPKLKLMFAVGGWNEGSEKYSRVMGDANLRRNFVQSALNFVLTYKFDGFDLDWEYPAFRGGKPSDKVSFSLVVKELADAFKPYGLILSAAVTANALNIAPSYDCVLISKYLDFINVMTYDLHGSWEKVTGHHTAMYRHPSDKPEDAHLNVETAIRAWIHCGATPSKLNLGVASYGRTFTLANSNNRGIGAPATGPGPAGSFVPEGGFLAYNEICWEQKQNLWAKYYEETQQVPFAVKNNVWVGYDDPASITKKVQLVKKLNLGGAMIWSIETDDFKGICGTGKNPLLNAVVKALKSSSQSEFEENEVEPVEPFQPENDPEYFPQPQPEVPEIPVVTGQPPANDGNYDYKCKTVGQLFRHPQDCAAFFMCTYKSVDSELKAVLMRCGEGLVFDESIEACNFQSPDCPLF